MRDIVDYPAIWIRYNLPRIEQLDCIKTSNLNDASTKRILFAPTRISPRKQIEDIIYVAEMIKDLDLKIVVSGGLDDTPYKVYAKKIRKLNELAGYPVHFNEISMGQEEVFQHYRDSLCVLSTSKVEGFGIFALEALNFLKPVISYDSVGIRELAKFRGFESCGLYIVPNSNEMAKQIRILYNEDESFLACRSLLSYYVARYNRIYSFESQIKSLLMSCQLA